MLSAALVLGLFAGCGYAGAAIEIRNCVNTGAIVGQRMTENEILCKIG